MNIKGLHHVTAIAGDPQRNLDFYAGVLGLRLVKRTVNFDDPGSYHFYFGDGAGTPGTILTFFPWPGARRGSRGVGEIEATAFVIPPESTGYWLQRLQDHRLSVAPVSQRFGDEVIRFADPDGMIIELIASRQAASGVHFSEGPVPEQHAIRGLHGVTAALDQTESSARLLTDLFGYRLTVESGNRARYSAPSDSFGREIDLVTTPGVPRGRSGGWNRPSYRLSRRRCQRAAQVAGEDRGARLRSQSGHGSHLFSVHLLSGTWGHPLRNRHGRAGLYHRRIGGRIGQPFAFTFLDGTLARSHRSRPSRH